MPARGSRKSTESRFDPLTWAFLGVPVVLMVAMLRDRFDFEGFWEFFPMRRFAWQSVLSGALPAWMSEPMCGFPVLACGEAATANPLALVGANTIGYLLYPVVSLLVLSVFTYLFFLERGIGRRAAAVLTIPCAIGPTAQYWYSNVNNTLVIALFAPALYLVERTIRRPSLGRVGWLALVVALILVGGHPQLALFDLIALSVYAVFRLGLTGMRARDLGRASAALAAAGGIGAAMAAVQVLPLLGMVGQTLRESVDAGFRNAGALDWAMFGHLVSPRSYDFTALDEVNYLPYLGLFPLAAIAFGMRRLLRREAAPLWAATALLTLLALGSHTPLFDLAALLPGSEMIRKSYWFVTYASWFAAALAATALDPRTEGGVRPPAVALLIAGAVLVASLAFYDASSAVRAINESPHVAILLLAVCSLGAWFVVKKRPGDAAWCAVALVLIADLAAWGLWREPAHERSIFDVDAIRPSPVVSWAADSRTRAVRVFVVPEDFGARGLADSETIPSSQIDMAYGLRTFWGWDEASLKPARAESAARRLFAFRLNVAYLQAAGVRYVLASHPFDLPGLEPVPGPPGLIAYRLPGAVPRAYLAPGVWPVRDNDEALDLFEEPGFDPQRATTVEGSPPVVERTEVAAQRIADDRPGRVGVGVDADRPSLLVVNETYMDGWRATVDGRDAPVYPANGQFLGVAVPAGRHDVRLAYRPRALRVGLIVTALASVVCLGLLGAGAWTARTARRSAR